MRIAVFSDIHSNDIAFQACIDWIDKNNIEGIILLGDYISDCPNPQQTLRLLKDLEQRYHTWYIKGNREQYFIDHHNGADDGWGYTSYKGSLLYTYENLTEEALKRFESYPDSRIIHIPGLAPIMAVHGSPVSQRELMYKDAENTIMHMNKIPVDYMLCGHTHEQFAFLHDNKTLINPGSIGVAIGVKSAAHFAVIEWMENKWEHEFIEIPYDSQLLFEQFYESELMNKAGVWPHCIIRSILTGVNYGPICAKAAFDMAVADGIDTKKVGVAEEYWQNAARKLKIISQNL